MPPAIVRLFSGGVPFSGRLDLLKFRYLEKYGFEDTHKDISAQIILCKGCPDDSVQKKTYIFQKNIMNSASNSDRFGVLKNQLAIESLIC